MSSSQSIAERSLADSQPTSWSWICFLFGIAMLPASALMLGLGWLAALLIEWRSRPRIQLSFPLLWLLVNSVLLVAICPFAYRPGDSFLGLFNYLPFFLFFGLALRLVDSAERVEQVVKVALVSGLVTGVAGCFEWFSGLNWWWQPLPGWYLLVIGSSQEPGILDRVTSFFGWPNSAAAFFLLILPLLAAGMLTRGANLPRLYSWIALLSIGISLAGTASRNAWGIALFICTVLLVLARRFWLVGVIVLIAVVVLIAGLGPQSSPVVAGLRQVVPAVLWQKVLASVQVGTASYESLNNRYDAWRIAWEMTLSRPLTGWGLQNFPFVEAEIFHRNAATLLHAHNLYLAYTSEAGIPAALALVGFYIWTILQGIRTVFADRQGAPRWQLIGLLAALVAYLLFGLSDVPFYDARINALFWLWLALVWRCVIGRAA